ncbi:segregation/condensation protein A [Streptomyces sp. NPDC046197]|uniref:segregation and condensation protein A n=1 Tax=Streptomyces sp. NPDC046197 TaxID=3154337 RepID=UPI0033C0030B
MTSNDSPASGPGSTAGRRRALGRGPGTAPAPAAAPPAAEPQAQERPEPGTASPKPEVVRAEPEAVWAEPGVVGAETGVVGVEPAVVRAESEAVWAEPGVVGAETGVVRAEPEVVRAEPDVTAPVPEPEPAAAPSSSSEPGAVREPGAGARAAAESDDGVFKVRLANFEGPFDLLLQLISKHKLDVTEVALSKVTDEFMAHIRAMGPDWDLDETTEFLVVAATLLDLKAARLLPAAEVEDEADLALLEARDLLFARLLQYRAYKQVADIFSHRLDAEARRHPRTVGLEPHHAELLPEVVISIGAEGFARLAVKAMQPRPKPQVYVDHIHAPLVSVQEQAGIVVARLRELGEASFRALVEDTDDTLTVVARFLALLELYREKAVALDQETALGELTVRWTGGDGNETPRVTDEFDRPPEQPEESKRSKQSEQSEQPKEEMA